MKDIPGFEGRYAITKEGEVWSYSRKNSVGRPAKGQWIKQRLQKGYPVVYLRGANRKRGRNYLIHRFLLLVFVGTPPIGRNETNHVNGKKNDNRLENLEWVSSSENRKHAWEIGLIKNTENRDRAALKRGFKLRLFTWDQAMDIRKMHSLGKAQTEIARQYKVNRKTINMIITRKTYAQEV